MSQKNTQKQRNAYISSGENIAVNKRARYDFEIEEEFEAGLALTGSEVKSLRLGRATIHEAHAGEKGGEIYLFNANIAEYTQAPRHAQHVPTRPRKLLLHKYQVNKLIGAVQQKGMTLVPMVLYFNGRGLAKLKVGLGKGKKMHDKRETEKKRDWSRQKNRILRDKN